MPYLFGFGNGMEQELQHPPGPYLMMGYGVRIALDFADMLTHLFWSSKHRDGEAELSVTSYTSEWETLFQGL